MKYWVWVDGRQMGTSYRKFCLFSFRLFKWGFDGYILKYVPFTVLDWHTDPVKDGKHWRKNWTLKGFATFCFRRDGEVYCTSKSLLFRPDIEEHKIIVHSRGCKKLSLGFVKFN